MTASASGAASSGSIPATLAALLNLPCTSAPGSVSASILRHHRRRLPVFSDDPTVTARDGLSTIRAAAARDGLLWISSTLAVIPATSGETLPAEPPAASLMAPPAAVIPIVPAPSPAASVAVVDPVAAPPPIVPAAGAITPTGPFHFDNLIAI